METPPTESTWTAPAETVNVDAAVPGAPTQPLPADPTVTASEPAEPGSSTSDGTASPSPGPTQPIQGATQTVGTPRPLGVAYDGRVYRKRSDDDVLSGHFCDVVAGPYEGRYGVLESTGTLETDGYPSEVVVATRDAEAENILVNYADIRPAESGRR
jgi:hypothetical protein